MFLVFSLSIFSDFFNGCSLDGDSKLYTETKHYTKATEKNPIVTTSVSPWKCQFLSSSHLSHMIHVILFIGYNCSGMEGDTLGSNCKAPNME